MAKWKNYSFRSTTGGNATWSGGTITDPQDSTNETNVVLPTTTYPTAGLDGNNYGRTGGSAPTGTNVTPTNAGNDPLLGGYHAVGANNHYQFDCAPGAYDVRIAFGNVSTRTVAFLFEGSVADVLTDTAVISEGFRFWTSGGTPTLTRTIVSKTDKSVWVCTTAGTSSTVEPSGAGPTFTDGTAVWTRKPRVALAWIDVTPSSASKVADHNNTATGVTASSWSGLAALSITITGNAFCLMRPQVTSYPRQFSYRTQPFTLAGLTVTDELEVNAGTTPTVYANEPSGVPILKLVTTNGTNEAAAFTLTGALASYYTVTKIGASSWITTNGTRIPDSLAGSRTLIVRQTDADATAPGYLETTLTCTVVSSQARPTTGIEGRYTTKTWLDRRTTKLVSDACWPGYVSGSFVSDVAVASEAALVTAIAAITPNGTGWYRVRLQNGTYQTNGVSFSSANKDFGTGGLLIEPDTGHNPMLEGEWNNLHIDGVHFKGLTFAPLDGYTSIRNTGSRTTAPFLKMKVSNCLIGSLYARPTSTPTQWGKFLEQYFAEEIILENNWFYGLEQIAISCGRLLRAVNNRYNLVGMDFHAIAPAYYYDTPRGVFTDDHTYTDISDNLAFANPDAYDGIADGDEPHADWFQHRRFMGTAYGYAPGPNNSQTGGWNHLLDQWVINKTEGRIYKVTGSTGGGTADINNPTALTGTGTIVSGEVTFTYWGELPDPVNHYLLMENNVILQQGESATTGNSATPNIQFLIDSNSASGTVLMPTLLNNICASPNVRGVGGGLKINVEYNTFAGPGYSPQTPDTPTITGSGANTVGNFIRAFKNIVGTSNTAPSIVGVELQTVWSFGNVAVNWGNSATVGYRPGDVMVGPFTQYVVNGSTPGRWGYDTSFDVATETSINFTSGMSKTLHPLTGDAGARSYEKHTLIFQDAASNQVTKDVYINI